MYLMNTFYAIHVVCSVIALLLGLLAMLTEKKQGQHTILGETYHWNYLALFLTTLYLSFGYDIVWWAVPTAVIGYSLALTGFLAARLQFKHWFTVHLIGQGGSYITISTEVLVLSCKTNSWWVWLIPSLLLIPLIYWLGRKFHKHNWTCPLQQAVNHSKNQQETGRKLSSTI